MDNVRVDDCLIVMEAFWRRLLKDAVGGGPEEDVIEARIFITRGYIEDEKTGLISDFTFEQLIEYIGHNPEVVIPIFLDLELIDWQKNSAIFQLIKSTVANF